MPFYGSYFFSYIYVAIISVLVQRMLARSRKRVLKMLKLCAGFWQTGSQLQDLKKGRLVTLKN